MCGQQVSGSFKRQDPVPFPTTRQGRAAPAVCSEASKGKLVAKLAESSHELRWRVRQCRFQQVGPSASPFHGFALAAVSVRGWALRHGTANVVFSEPSASKQRPVRSSLESVAIQPAPCHNHGFNRTRGKLLAGKAGQARWRRRLTQTLYANGNLIQPKRTP